MAYICMVRVFRGAEEKMCVFGVLGGRNQVRLTSGGRLFHMLNCLANSLFLL